MVQTIRQSVSLLIAVAVLISGSLPAYAGAQSHNINIPSGSSVSVENKAYFSDNTFTPAATEYEALITSDLSIWYNGHNTAKATADLQLQNNTLKLKGGTFTQTDKNPLAAARVFMSNSNPKFTTDLQDFALTLKDNTLNTAMSADLSGWKGNLFGALLETENTNIGTVTLSNNTVNAAVDTNTTGTEIFGAEWIANVTNSYAEITVDQNITDNIVNISDGIVNNKVIGAEMLGVIKDNGKGITLSGNVSNNKVSITKGTIQTHILGGVMAIDSQNDSHTLQMTGDVSNNEVEISSGVFNGATIVGGSISLEGYKAKADSVLTSSVHDNKITISGGKFQDSSIIGGVTTVDDDNGAMITGDIKHNIVEISGDTTFKGQTLLYGSFTNGQNKANENTLILHADKGLTVYGLDGFNNYKMDISNAAANDIILRVTQGNGHNNPLYAKYGLKTINEAIDVDGATMSWAESGRPTRLSLGDSVILLKNQNSFGITGTLANHDETQQFVEGEVTYGYKLRQRDDRIEVLHNVLQTTGNWNKDISMSANSYAGDDLTMTVAGTLKAKNITVSSSAQADATLTANTLDVTANDTNLTLNGTQYGERNAYFDNIQVGNDHTLNKSGTALYSFGTMNIQGNSQVTSLDAVTNSATVTLSDTTNAQFDTINLADAASLFIDTSSGGKYSFKNLNVYDTDATFNGDLNARGKNLNFYLTQDTAAGDIALHITGAADIKDSTVQVGITGSSSVLKKDDKVTLIQAGSVTGTPVSTSSVGMQGLMVKYDFDLEMTADKLIAIVTNTKLTENSKAFLEGRAAAGALLIQGADFASQEAFSAAQTAAQNSDKLAVFSAVGGGKSRYETGSHVDVSGLNAAVGLSHQEEGSFNENWLFGSFVEYGYGHYRSYNEFLSGPVKASGDTQYIGLGILGRRTAQNNTYVEVSARIGQTDTDFDGKVYNTNSATYDFRSLYYGVHGGLGYVWQCNDEAALDISGKYIWTHQNSKSVEVSTGDKIDFNSFNSNRARAGMQLSYQLGENWKPYLGAAYDYEFSGKAYASAYGLNIDAPSLRGATGIGEIGLNYTNDSFFIGLAGQGFIGRRRGGSGNIKLGYAF